MSNANWRKRLSVWQNRLYLYPPAEPLPHTRSFWLAMGVVTFLVLLFSGYFILFLTTGHDAYQTHAEDLGIMDQAIWNTLHGSLLHQTICNIVNDTNCYSVSGMTRFAIHFEPILFPISLLYLTWPGPKTLLVIQTLVVASGAFPAFWLARLRLRNEWAAVAIAALYLLYPAQQQAIVFDFHAVTFTAALLLFMLYFMYTRRTAGLIVFAVLAMACKEEIPVVVAFYGLWSIVFQHRWRSGLALVVQAIAWTGLGLLVVHFYSPAGHSLLTSRYSYLGNGPVQIARTILFHPVMILKQHVLEHSHFQYFKSLLSPAAYLPLLAPWVLVLALPTLTLNLLSSDQQTYSGLFHYNAEMVPALIFATIEAMVLILWVAQWVIAHLQQQKVKDVQADSASLPVRIRPLDRLAQQGLLVVLLGIVLFSVVRSDYFFYGRMPFSKGFQWPQISAHTDLARHFIDMIPSTASVSAQSALAPHISQRRSIYLFPYADSQADYVFLDVSSDIYPFFGSRPYIHEVKKVLLSGNYGIVAAQDGYLLLKRGLPPPGISVSSPIQDSSNLDIVLPNLPENFCTFIQSSPQQINHPVQATFTSANGSVANLIGYNVAAADPSSVTAGYMQVTTYWQVQTTTLPSLQLQVLLTDKNGVEHIVSTDFPGLNWCPTNTWKPGKVLQLTSRIFSIQGHGIPVGLAHVSLVLLPLAHQFDTIMDVQDRLPIDIEHAPGTVSSTGTKALQLVRLTIIP